MTTLSKTDFVSRLKDLTIDTPVDGYRIKTIDMHTGGEPLRVIIDGFPELKGSTILEYRRYCRENYDFLRTALMFEPRGHADMYGCILTPPCTEEADFGTFFLHNEGYSTMCGHAIIAITTLVVDQGLVELNESGDTCVKIDSPAGLITSYARTKDGKTQSVYFHNVPSYVAAPDQEVEVEGIGKIKYDLAYGGAFYAYLNVDQIGLDLSMSNANQIIDYGKRIKKAVIESCEHIRHPFEEDLSFLYGTIFIGEAHGDADNRNVCIFAEGEVDRSPTGTGVSGRAAIHHSRGEMPADRPMKIESIVGSAFQVHVHEETKFADFDAIIPQVEGQAHIVGQNEFIIDPEDPFKDGFIFR